MKEMIVSKSGWAVGIGLALAVVAAAFGAKKLGIGIPQTDTGAGS